MSVMWNYWPLILAARVFAAPGGCGVPGHLRTQCGFAGIGQGLCLASGCCWEAAHVDSNSLECFKPWAPANVSDGSILLVYVEKEAGAEARLLELGWTAQGASVIFTPEYILPDGLSWGLPVEAIAQAKAVVLLQTESLMSCGPCLLMAYWAAFHDVPVLPISIAGGGYSYGGAKNFLLNLDADQNADATRALRTNGVDLSSAAWRLGTSLPYIISLTFDGTGARGTSSIDPGLFIYNIIVNSLRSVGPGLPNIEAFKTWRDDASKNVTSSALLPYQPDKRHFDVYLSNYIKEGGRSARLLKQMMLQDKSSGIDQIFLDVDDLHDLRQEATNVVQSKALVMMGTQHFFTRPYCLLETYWAMNSGARVVLVEVVGAGFDFEQTQQFLATLDRSLEVANPGATATFRENGVSISDVQRVFMKRFQARCGSTQYARQPCVEILPFYQAAATKTLKAQVSAIMRSVTGDVKALV